MAKTNLEEEIHLRALTGIYVGQFVLDSYTKVAVISQGNIICSSLSAASEAVFVSDTGGRTAHFIAENRSVPRIVKSVQEFAPQAILLMFGGETPMEETKKLFVEVLEKMAKAELEGDIILNVRIFAAGGLQDSLKKPKIKEYLLNREIIVYTFDLNIGLFFVNWVEMDDEGKISLEKIEEYPVTAEHADLLNRSIRDRKLSWEDINKKKK